jgi:Holliday junction resolvase
VSASERRKGAAAEVEIVQMLRAAGWPHARRNFGSGAAGGNDIVAGPAGTAIEVKRQERLNVPAAFSQLLAAARPTDLPVLVHRPSRHGWMATLPLDELLALLRLRES